MAMARSSELVVCVETPHGAPVQGASVKLRGPSGLEIAKEIGPGRYAGALRRSGDWELVVEGGEGDWGMAPLDGAQPHRQPAPAFSPLHSVLFYEKNGNGGELSALVGREDKRSRVVSVNRVGDRYVARVVLDYVWFSHIGFPPTSGNGVEILVDGEDGWRAVAKAMAAAQRSVRVVTWQYEPSMELVRPDPLAEPKDREAHTIQRMLEACAERGALVQLLLWDVPLVGMPGEARRVALADGDGFEVLAEKNPTGRTLFDARFGLGNRLIGYVRIGSFHQKTVVVDGRIGFCGGMNMRENDWDTRKHRLFDPSRCRFSRPGPFRCRVKDGLESADHAPRHDFVARIEGPAVAHLEENFRERWNRLLDRKVEHAERASRVEAYVPRLERPGTSLVQVVRTMPAPAHERGILDVYLRAIAAAKKLIYIEDQFFRSTYVSDAIAEAARKNPSLAVLVLANEGEANHPITGGWSHGCFERIKAAIPNFTLFSMRVAGRDAHGKRRVVEVDNHGKLLLVDDVFLTVGSCNVNDRGFEYEGECNVAVFDPKLVSCLRLGLFRDYLDDDPRLGQSIARDVEVFREHASRNATAPPKDAAHPYIVPFVPQKSRLPFFDRGVF